NNRRCLCLSWLQSEDNDYRLYDAEFFAEMLNEEITHIRKHWVEPEVAVFTLIIRANVAELPGFDKIFDALRQLQLRTTHEHVGNASANLAVRASRTTRLTVPDFPLKPLKSTTTIAHSALTLAVDSLVSEAARILTYLDKHASAGLYKDMANLCKNYRITDSVSHDGTITLQDFLHCLYAYGRQNNHWALTRLTFASLHQSHSDLPDSLTLLAARHLVIVVGEDSSSELIISSELSKNEIIDGINAVFSDALERILAQEIILAIGTLLRTQPYLFEGLRSIQLHNFMLLCSHYDEPEDELTAIQWLGTQAPGYLYQKLRNVFDSQRKLFDQGVDRDFLYNQEASQCMHGADDIMARTIDTDWLEWRQIRGLVTRLDNDFLAAIWKSLAHTPRLVFGDTESDDTIIHCELVRSSMTSGEESFAQLIDQHIQALHPSHYKSAVMEALYSFTQFCSENPDSHIDQPVVFSRVLERAAERWLADNNAQAGTGRALDQLLQQAPGILHCYLQVEFSDMAGVASQE
ncbi:MAG TPA: phosphorylase kinase, partial [Cellvibrionaceae bacterium]